MSPGGEGGAGCIHAVRPLDAGIVGSFVTVGFVAKKRDLGESFKGWKFGKKEKNDMVSLIYSEIFR